MNDYQVAAQAEKLTSAVLRSISETPEDAVMYRTVGKLFLQVPREEIKTRLQDQITQQKSELDRLREQISAAQRQSAAMEKASQ